MPAPKVDEATFVALWHKHGGAAGLSKAIGVSQRQILERRKRIEDRIGVSLEQTSRPELSHQTQRHSQLRRELEIVEGVVMVASDAHYTPGEPTEAHKAFVKLAGKLKPVAIVMAGDIMDLASMSRHGRSAWEKVYSVKEEIQSAQDRMGEIVLASPRSKRFLLWGNHDAGRFERFLANNASMMVGMPGMTIAEHFPEWSYHGSLMVNEEVMLKHFWHTGVHGAYNNVVKSGISMVTGHTHKLLVRPYTDYRGTRYGIECGCLADPDDHQFDYGMDSPKDHRSGFVVLTFKAGKLLPPETCEVVPGVGAVFRGEVL